MYSESATPKDGTFVPKGPKPVFARTKDIPQGAAPISGEQIYIALTKTVPNDDIMVVQRIGSLWRIYLNSHESRVRLITNGLEVRGITVPVHDTNPFTQSKNEHLTRVTVKDVPLSVGDELISQTLEKLKCRVRGEIVRQKLRVNGQLTGCLNGDRVCFIDPPTQPLPRKVTISNVFRARLFHIGQPQGTSNCSKCMETGHSAFQCTNPVKCRTCLKSGHMSNTCPIPLTDELRNTDSGVRESHAGNPRHDSSLSDRGAASNTTHHASSTEQTSSTTGAKPKQRVESESAQTRKPRQVDIAEFLRRAKQPSQCTNDNKTQSDEGETAESDGDDSASTASDNDDGTLSPLSPETPTPTKNGKGGKKRKRKKPNEKK